MPKQKILIIDDTPANIKVLGETLKSEYQVLVATHGESGLQICASPSPPDLILLDIIMPGMDGYEVCRRLKADRETRNIPIIFITAMSEIEDETKGLELGAVDYIIKPFVLAIVKARVRTHLELKQHRDFFENLSSLDGLTGIPNRRKLDQMLDNEWRRTSRERGELSLVMLDIDCFKAYNDCYGHLTGDECIKKVATTLATSASRAGDFVGRYGGEEFASILPGVKLKDAVAFAEKVRLNIASLHIPHAASMVADHVTVSLGAATMSYSPRFSPEELVEQADKALYQAKQAGRNQVK